MDKAFRLSGLTTAALAASLLVFWLSPNQFPVVLHKLALMLLGGVLGYWVDRHIFPYARPHMVGMPYRSMAMLRRAIIVAASMIGVGLGL